MTLHAMTYPIKHQSYIPHPADTRYFHVASPHVPDIYNSLYEVVSR
jgi:hypothetical protein